MTKTEANPHRAAMPAERARTMASFNSRENQKHSSAN
jgi:hypothetical protein